MRKFGMLGVLLLCVLAATGVGSALSVSVHWNGNGQIFANVENGANYAELTGRGDYLEGSFWATSEGAYVDTDVFAYGENAMYKFEGSQKLAGYTDNNANVFALVDGDEVMMNLRFDQSNYVVQLERHDTSKPLLMSAGDDYWMTLGAALMSDDKYTFPDAGYTIEIDGSDGFAVIDTNQWHPTAVFSYGWGNPDVIHVPAPAGYYTPVNYVHATGYGEVYEQGFGTHYVSWNGYVMSNGGAFGFVAEYNGEFYAQPDVTLY